MPRGVHGSVAEHGTAARYNGGGCRCDECRQAIRVYHRKIYGRIPREEWRKIIEPPHGTESRYTKHRCRCDLCREASRDARRRRRAAEIKPVKP